MADWTLDPDEMREGWEKIERCKRAAVAEVQRKYPGLSRAEKYDLAARRAAELLTESEDA